MAHSRQLLPLLTLLGCRTPAQLEETDTVDNETGEPDTDPVDDSGGETGDETGGGETGDDDTGEVPVDNDGDGYTTATDCDDTDPNVHPGVETDPCDGVDNDCDGFYDEDYDRDTESLRYYYPDEDGDLRSPGGTDLRIQSCKAPEGYTFGGDDCDDTEPLAWRYAPDICDDGIDNDCDGELDEGPCGKWVGADTIALRSQSPYVIPGADMRVGGDLTGDGSPDLVLSGLGPEVGDSMDDGLSTYGAWVLPRVDVERGWVEDHLVGPFWGGEYPLDVPPWVARMPVASAGDLNGDGYEDLAYANPYWPDVEVGTDSSGDEWRGRVLIALGPITGLIEADEADAVLLGDWEHGQAGSVMEAVGDLDGDGVPSITAIQRDGDYLASFYLLEGPLSGSSMLGDWPSYTSEAPVHSAYSAPGGDFDGDGLPDLVVREVGYETLGGEYTLRTSVYLGVVDDDFGLSEPDLVVESADQDWSWGTPQVLRDVTGDGVPDLYLLGRDVYATGDDRRAHIFDGNLRGTVAPSVAGVQLSFDGTSSRGGTAELDDVTGDDCNDLAVHKSWGGEKVYILPGCLEGSVVVEDTAVVLYGETWAESDNFAMQVQAMDLVGDESRDLIVSGQESYSYTYGGLYIIDGDTIETWW